MHIAGAIFDLDGTLINNLPIVIEAFRSTFTRFVCRSFSDEEIISLFGPSEEGVVRQVLQDQWQEGLAVYYSEYEALSHQRKIGPFPGIEDALRLLKKRNIRTAIVTGKGASSTAISLQQAGLDGYFDLVQTGSPDRPIKPKRIQEALALWSMAPSKAFYLGDSPSDIQDARKAGVIPLGAAWAEISNWDELSEQNPQAIFATPQELIKWIESSLK